MAPCRLATCRFCFPSAAVGRLIRAPGGAAHGRGGGRGLRGRVGLATLGSVAPSVGPVRYTGSVPDEVIELLLTEAALDKLGARNISAEEASQLLRNAHVVAGNPHEPTPGRRRLLIGRTDGWRCLTLVIEKTVEPTTWLGITGWESTEVERKLLPG